MCSSDLYGPQLDSGETQILADVRNLKRHVFDQKRTPLTVNRHSELYLRGPIFGPDRHRTVGRVGLEGRKCASRKNMHPLRNS